MHDSSHSNQSSGANSTRGRVWKLSIYLALLAAIAIGLSARRLSAQLGEQGMVFGRQLAGWEAFSGRRTDVVLNGQPFSLHTRTVQRSVSDVLDDFARVCSAGSERTTDEFIAKLPVRTGAERAALARLFVMRDQRRDQEGTAVCLAGLGQGGFAALTERFGRFAETLDVSDLGALRYVYVHKVAQGTHTLFVTADGPLPLLRLWPSDGRDVVGSEPIPGARPRDAVRFLSAQLKAATQGFTAYRSPHAPGQVLRDYAEQVRVQGYEVLDLAQLSHGRASEDSAPAVLGEGVELRVLRQGERTFVATAAPDGAGSTLSVVQL